MANTQIWNPLRSGRAAAMWGAGIAAATVGGVLWRQRKTRPWPEWALGGADRHRSAQVLSNLITTCVDGEEGFQTAAGGVKDPQIRSLFREYSRQRRRFRLELERAMRRLGRSPDTSGSMAGALQHAWMEIKSVVTRGDEGAIVAEAERGEDTAVRAYQDALNAGLPPELREIVERQFIDIEAAHDRVRQLERAHTQA